MTDQFSDDNFSEEEVKPIPTMLFKKSTEWEQGEKITGVFLGTHYSTGPVDKPFDRPAAVHRVMTNVEGAVIALNGCGALNNRFANVDPFTVVRVEYEGPKTIESGKYAGDIEHVFTIRQGKPGAMAEMVDHAKKLPPFDPKAVAAPTSRPKAEAVGDLFPDDSAPAL